MLCRPHYHRHRSKNKKKSDQTRPDYQTRHSANTYILPELSSSPNDGIGSSLSLPLLVVGLSDLSHVLHSHMLPDAVRSQNQNLVIFLQVKMLDLRLTNYTDFLCLYITN